jgi:hypothetical protein
MLERSFLNADSQFHDPRVSYATYRCKPFPLGGLYISMDLSIPMVAARLTFVSLFVLVLPDQHVSQT